MCINTNVTILYLLIGQTTAKKSVDTWSQKLDNIVTAKKYKVVNVPTDGDCAIHALIDQLQHQRGVILDVETVRKNAVHYLRSHTELFNDSFLLSSEYKDSQDYLLNQTKQKWAVV
jgi:hypothetical protein